MSDKVNRALREAFAADPSRDKFPFQFIALRSALGLEKSLVARPANEDAVDRFQRTIEDDEAFADRVSADVALTLIVDELGRMMLFDEDSTISSIPVTVCRRKKFDGNGTILPCCVTTAEDLAEGCDKGAGTVYYAKTDTQKIVFSGLLRNSKSRKQPIVLGGVTVPSLTLFATMHEFGHIISLRSPTAGQFEIAREFYRLLQSKIDPKLAGRVEASEADMNEFLATLFAVEALRADRRERESVEE